MTLLFDLDNTLVDRNTAYRLWLQCLFKNHCIKLNERSLQLLLNADNWGYTSRFSFYNTLLEHYPLPYTVDQMILKCSQELATFVPSISKVTRDILIKLKSNHHLAIVTNGSYQNQKNKLIRSGLDTIFEQDNIFISSEIGFDKPDPIYFDYVQSKLQKATDELVIIGDDPINDIKGGCAAGWQTVWFSKNRKQEVNSDWTIVSLEQLSEIW